MDNTLNTNTLCSPAVIIILTSLPVGWSPTTWWLWFCKFCLYNSLLWVHFIVDDLLGYFISFIHFHLSVVEVGRKGGGAGAVVVSHIGPQSTLYCTCWAYTRTVAHCSQDSLFIQVPAHPRMLEYYSITLLFLEVAPAPHHTATSPSSTPSRLHCYWS